MGAALSFCTPFRTGSDRSLVRDVYPSGKALANAAPDYSPDSNKLGKLAYYCEINPTQLSLVAGHLVKAARSDSKTASKDAKAKARLCITLAILKRLIVDCKGNLSFFAREAVEIIELAVGVHETRSPGGTGGEPRRDIEVAERASSAFFAFATFAEQTSIGIDAAITQRYISCLAQFGSLAKEPYSNDTSIPGARLVGLHAVEGAVSSDILFSANFPEQARYILSTLLYNVLPTKTFQIEELRQLAQEDTNNEEWSHSLQKRQPIADRKAREIRSGKNEEKETSERDVATRAVKVLRHLFASGHSAQLSASVESSIDWLDSRGSDMYWSNVEWCCWLADSMALWTNLQYRFVIVGALVDSLSHRIDEPNVTAQQTTLVAMLTTILTSETSLVGLGIGDVLAQILGLITRRSRISSQDALLPALTNCLAALATHIYYADQINDMVQEITNAVISLQSREGSNSSVPTSGGTSAAIRCHVQSLYLVLRRAGFSREVISTVTEQPKKAKGTDEHIEDTSAPIIRVANTGKRSPIHPAIFQDSLFLMVDGDPVVRVNYLHALLYFVSQEIPQATCGREAIARFQHALHAYAYELITSRQLGLGTSRPSSAHRDPLSRKPSIANSLTGEAAQMASPGDYALLRDVLVLVHSNTGQSEAAVSGLPALFALEGEAHRIWLSESEAARQQATLEVSRTALAAAGKAWNVKIAQPSSSMVLPRSVTYDMAINGNYEFGAPSKTSRSSGGTPEAFAASTSLQQSSHLSQETLESTLSEKWTVEKSMQRSGRNNTPYARGTLRIISSTSVAALNTQNGSPNGAASLRAPSVADLKATLGDQSSVSPGSPDRPASIKSRPLSYRGGAEHQPVMPTYQRRRSAKISKHEALAALNQTPSQITLKPNRMSLQAPPYAM